jgi:tetratricopeptide (TPR) repeat protein
MIKRFRLFLGETRLRALFVLLALTGLGSLVLNAVDADWTVAVQTLMLLLFFVGAVVIILSAMKRDERLRWLAIIAPAFGALVLALTVGQQFSALLLGGAGGWVIAAALIFKPRSPMAYRVAIKHLRRSEYEEAVKAMTDLIKEEPREPNHYRFRAEILRLWGKLERARKDYLEMANIAPDSALAYNGLAEVDLQSGKFERARESARRAYELAPTEWVAAYNLGMVEDRLGDAPNAAKHLYEALALKVPDVRHRLLIHLYLVRALMRQGERAAAERELANLKQHESGVSDWQQILENEQADTLRAVLETDVQQAEALINGTLELEALAGGVSS